MYLRLVRLSQNGTGIRARARVKERRKKKEARRARARVRDSLVQMHQVVFEDEPAGRGIFGAASGPMPDVLASVCMLCKTMRNHASRDVVHLSDLYFRYQVGTYTIYAFS